MPELAHGYLLSRQLVIRAEEQAHSTAEVGSSPRSITIDRTTHLDQQPRTGHNRWHPDIGPVLEVEPGELVILETRDAVDGYLNSVSTVAEFANLPLGGIHPLTGPVFVKGAKPGDLLEIEFVDIQPQPWAWSAIMPGLGFLRESMTTAFLVHWRIEDGWATSPQIPGVRIPGAPFMGVSGVAPSRHQVAEWARREADVAARGSFVMQPDLDGAVPYLASLQLNACARFRRVKTAGTST